MLLSKSQTDFLRLHWPIEGEIRFHRHVANFVYFAQMQSREVVLRLTEPSHRKFAEIESELHWIRYLTENGMRIANPILSNSGELAVQLDGEQNYFASVFEKAPGAFLNHDEDVQDEMIKRWGRYIGRMHNLTKSYRRPAQIQPRQSWQDESLSMALRSHEKSDALPYQRLNELLEWMRALPQSEDGYGLIHTDLHRGNFFVENGEITAFDFDDSCHQWLIYDFVAPINSMHRAFSEGVQSPEKSRVLEIFMTGYRLENNLSLAWLKRFEIFDQYRAALVYHWIKTFTREGVFDAKGLEWAKTKAPRLMEVFRQPLHIF